MINNLALGLPQLQWVLLYHGIIHSHWWMCHIN